MDSERTIDEFNFATDGVTVTSSVARSEIAIQAMSMEKQGMKALTNLTIRELKDAFYDLKALDGTKCVYIRGVCLNFTAAEKHAEGCICHIQRIIDHHNRFNT